MKNFNCRKPSRKVSRRMTMLSINATGVLLDIKPHTEKNGDPRLVCDVKLSLNLTNGYLAEFHPSLASRFYKIKDSPQSELEGLFKGAELSSLAFPSIKEVHWKAEFANCNVILVPAVSKPIQLTSTKVHKIVFGMEEGGKVRTVLQVQSHPSTADVARLCEVLGYDLDISIEQQDVTTAAV